MTAAKVKRCKRIILKPEYCHDRAIQMGETYGAWTAQLLIAKEANDKYMHYKAINYTGKFFHRMQWYIRKIK